VPTMTSTPAATPLPVVVVPTTPSSPATTISTPGPTSTTTRPQTTTTTRTTTTTSEPPVTIKVYANCAALNVDYPHGVARTGGVDLVSGKPRSPQPKFKVDDAVYDANPARDGDDDGVACEKV